MIRPAKISEFSEIPEIVKTCAQQIMQNAIFQWNEHCPSFIAFERGIEKGKSYVLQGNGTTKNLVLTNHSVPVRIAFLTRTHNQKNYGTCGCNMLDNTCFPKQSELSFH